MKKIGEYRGFDIFDTEEEIIAISPEYRGEKLGVKADFAQASDAIYVLHDDGEWITHPEGKQVASYRHSAIAAIKGEIDSFLDFSD